MFAQKQAVTVTMPSDDSVVVGTTTIRLNGQLGPISVSVPAMTGTGTSTILGTDSIGGTIYTATAVAESAKVTIPPFGTPGYFDGDLSLTATASGTQAATVDVSCIVYYGAKQG